MTRRNYKYAVISYRKSLALSGGEQAYKSTFWPMIYYLIYKVFYYSDPIATAARKFATKLGVATFFPFCFARHGAHFQ